MKPSEHAAIGECPSCCGTGRVEKVVPIVDVYPCATCHGTGEFPPPDDDWEGRR